MKYNIELTVECGQSIETYQYDGDSFNYGITRLYDIQDYTWRELEVALKDIIRENYEYYDINNIIINIYESDTENIIDSKQYNVEDLL